MKTHAIQIYMLTVASVGLLLASCGKKQSAVPSVPPIDVSAVTTDYVEESLHDVMTTFLLTILIVMIVILIFLQDWRAVIIPMITIPARRG